MRIVSTSIMSLCIGRARANNNGDDGVTLAETQLHLLCAARDEHASAVSTAIRSAKSVLGTTTLYVSSLKGSHPRARTFWGPFVSMDSLLDRFLWMARVAKNVLQEIQLTNSVNIIASLLRAAQPVQRVRCCILLSNSQNYRFTVSRNKCKLKLFSLIFSTNLCSKVITYHVNPDIINRKV